MQTADAHLLGALSAALHDVVEDSFGGILVEDISAAFGNVVGDAIDALTRRTKCEAPPSTVVYEDYLGEYIHRVCQNPLATIVKHADLLDHLRNARGVLEESQIERYNKALALVTRAVTDFFTSGQL